MTAVHDCQSCRANSRSKMTGRARMRAALRGEPVDRPPIWLREGFCIHGEPGEAGDFQNAWQADPLYRDLLAHVRPHADDFVGWGIGGQNRLVMVHPSALHHEQILETADRHQSCTTIRTPHKDLTAIRETRRGACTTWHIKHAVESREDLEAVMDVPWSLDEAWIEHAKASYRRADALGEAGLPMAGISSPIVCISGAMPFDLFLELSLTERDLFGQVCEEITRRYLAILDRVFDEPMDTAINFGGSEQCTPPMMPPAAYDEYVVPYDGQIVRLLKERGALVKIHCHGKVRRALEGMIAMGADGTDPVEPPPAGDVTYAEARAIAGDRLTLFGNLEWDELEAAEPAQIRARIEEMLAHGTERLVFAASAGPISAVSPRLAANYRAWVDAVLDLCG